ncbi:succinylglutamate desuccinylase/aspartoacylase family protein [Chitinimonas sp. BJB300]|uniref:succinylglutamate desuccinylase/aspartoacylase family protein n=1 Tax=Chitinimonas sp. BJB300 TaxID=1559339 RepID=UPI000C0D1B50|nr:succinylglutamate desuccinylase/aspartoacylase family protein [Chitinimonas sp. BJB300]PHV11757.1 succinylglutamate desuccinylase [Chitinimonas sp. BJB300]TSJ87104.1 succinylglutamate desuccinylase/aspartoacylase family protein [Chitinimonas sp. BJB300]
MQVKRHALLSPSVGTQRELLSFHYGQPGRGQKVYMQASLHADELPGMLVLYHLKQKLAALEASGALLGEVVVVPVANPIGLSQTLMHGQLGRFDFAGGENFNRQYPDFLALLGDQIESRLGNDAEANKRAIRTAMAEALRAIQPATELASLRHTLVTMACDADVVLDLHCDFEAVMHLYTETPYLPQAEPLNRFLGARAVLLAKGSGGASFDEALSGHWWQLAERFAGRFPIPLACFSATVELRGETEVYHPVAEQDAMNLITFLQHRGVVAGPAPALPAALCEPTPLAGSETLSAPHAGVLVFLKQPGDYINVGEAVAEVIDPLSDVISTVCATVSGVLYARSIVRYATAGMDLCKVAGKVAFRSGPLLGA